MKEKKKKAISEVLTMLLIVIIVLGLMGLTYFYISGVVGRQMAGVIHITYSTCLPNSRIEILAINGGTSNISAGDIRVFIANGLITAKKIKSEDKATDLLSIEPGSSFWILVEDVDPVTGGNQTPLVGRIYRGQVVYAGKASEFIVTC